jgi:hypothetical protein
MGKIIFSGQKKRKFTPKKNTGWSLWSIHLQSLIFSKRASKFWLPFFSSGWLGSFCSKQQQLQQVVWRGNVRP